MPNGYNAVSVSGRYFSLLRKARTSALRSARADLSEKHLEPDGTSAETLGTHFVTNGHVNERVA